TSPTDEEHFLRPKLRPDFFGLSKNIGNVVCFEETLRFAPYPRRASPSRCIKHFPLLTSHYSTAAGSLFEVDVSTLSGSLPSMICSTIVGKKPSGIDIGGGLFLQILSRVHRTALGCTYAILHSYLRLTASAICSSIFSSADETVTSTS
ncbi:MAG: hypothetical protein RL069_186, partial [Planctomycetota bacterium]